VNAVAVASRDGEARKALAQYLEAAGFSVDQFDQPPRARPQWSLVWLTEREAHARVIDAVITSWLDEPRVWRVVVVTWRPVALRPHAERYGVRLAVLAPPVFGWNIVDPLRGGDGGPEAA
jgi:hypothetical protein